MDGLDRAYMLVDLFLKRVEKVSDDYYLSVPGNLRKKPKQLRIIDLPKNEDRDEGSET